MSLCTFIELMYILYWLFRNEIKRLQFVWYINRFQNTWPPLPAQIHSFLHGVCDSVTEPFVLSNFSVINGSDNAMCSCVSLPHTNQMSHANQMRIVDCSTNFREHSFPHSLWWVLFIPFAICRSIFSISPANPFSLNEQQHQLRNTTILYMYISMHKNDEFRM